MIIRTRLYEISTHKKPRTNFQLNKSYQNLGTFIASCNFSIMIDDEINYFPVSALHFGRKSVLNYDEISLLDSGAHFFGQIYQAIGFKCCGLTWLTI